MFNKYPYWALFKKIPGKNCTILVIFAPTASSNLRKNIYFSKNTFLSFVIHNWVQKCVLVFYLRSSLKNYNRKTDFSIFAF